MTLLISSTDDALICEGESVSHETCDLSLEEDRKLAHALSGSQSSAKSLPSSYMGRDHIAVSRKIRNDIPFDVPSTEKKAPSGYPRERIQCLRIQDNSFRSEASSDEPQEEVHLP